MRCSSGSTAGCGSCGVRSTSTATCSTFSSSHAETRWRPSDSSVSCSRAWYVPRVLVTDKLGSYQVAHRELMSSVEHRRSRYLNRAENSPQPTRQRERAMKRFKSSRHAQRFLSAFSGISAHFRPRRHLLSATEWRTEMADRFAVWRQVTAPDAAA
jgi:putative transposase